MSLFPKCTFEYFLDTTDAGTKSAAKLVAGRRNDGTLVLQVPEHIPRAEHLTLDLTTVAWAGYGSGKHRRVIRQELLRIPMRVDMPPEGMPAGRHSYPFHFDLPGWLPPAFQGADCGIAHEVKAALDVDPRLSNSEGGSFGRVAGGSAIVLSSGFRAAYKGSYQSLSVVPLAEDVGGKKRRGYHWTAKRHLAELDTPEAVGIEAARRTLRKLGAKTVATCEVPVVFDPDAARSILGLLAGCVMGGSIWRKSSYLVGREGTRVASDLVTVLDDPLIPRAPGSRPFDGEGLASRQNLVVEDGLLRTYLCDSYSARKLGRKSTGSASRGGSAGVSGSTSNFILKPGKDSPEAILKGTKRGLYVTDMMGFGFNAVTGDFSRGASGFWIEDGELAFPVSEVTISLNVDELWKTIDAVGSDLDLRTSTASPTFRVAKMTVAGGAEEDAAT